MGKIAFKKSVFSPGGSSLYTFYVEHEYVSTEEELTSIAGSAVQHKATAAWTWASSLEGELYISFGG